MESDETGRVTEELIVLLGEDGREVGTASKLASHHANTPLHKAFSCYVFNDRGQLLVTQRALSKKVWPGVWTNSVCGHPAPGETYEAAISRRARDELGMSLIDIAVALPDYRYKTPPFNGIIENEICPVYLARLGNGPAPNPVEVEAYKWMAWQDYLKALANDQDKYSYWAKDQAIQLQNHPFINQYTTNR
jgi:isopentenyl-diphosphate Delta-isomerase